MQKSADVVQIRTIHITRLDDTEGWDTYCGEPYPEFVVEKLPGELPVGMRVCEECRDTLERNLIP